MSVLEEIAARLESGEDERVHQLTKEAVAAGLAAAEILDDGLLAGMAVVGEKFRRHEVFLPDVLLAARAMYAGLDLLEPLLKAEQAPRRGKVVLGTVRGDQHDIGKNLVGIMLEGAGYEVIDLGIDVPAEAFVDAAQDQGATVIGLSALLTTTMVVMGEVTGLVRERGLEGQMRTLVGGAPVTADFARRIGADAFGYDAADSVVQVQALVEATGC
ncbi:MAG: corrinoid protein [Thermoanaerobaculales bacterium]